MNIFYLLVIFSFCQADTLSDSFIWGNKTKHTLPLSEQAHITRFLEIAHTRSIALLRVQEAFLLWEAAHKEFEITFIKGRLQPITASFKSEEKKCLTLYTQVIDAYQEYKIAATTYAHFVEEYLEKKGGNSAATHAALKELKNGSRKAVLAALSKEWPQIIRSCKDLAMQIAEWKNDVEKLPSSQRSILEQIASFLVPVFSTFDERYQLIYNKSTLTVHAYKQIGFIFWKIIEETRSNFYQVYLETWKTIS
jgi:hypothetical protein